MNSGLSDNDLLRKIKNDDSRSFEILYKKYWELLYRHCLTMSVSISDAEDVVQEVFTVFWKNRASLNVHGTVSSYLYKSVRNNVLNRIKHDAVVAKYLSSLYLDDFTLKHIPEDEVIAKELAANIERCIEALTPKVKEIFILSREEGLTHRQISVLLNISELTVKRQISTALSAIRTRIQFLLIFI